MADQFDGQFMDEILNLLNDDVSPSIINKNNEDQNVILQNFSNLLSGPYCQELYTSKGGENSKVGPSQINNDENGEEGHTNLGTDHHNNFDENRDFMPLCSWPLPPMPFNCSCCQVLREIIHVKGEFVFFFFTFLFY